MGYPPFAMPDVIVSRAASRVDAMPPIEDFLDELPSIDDYIDVSSSGLPSIDDFLATDAVAMSEQSQTESGQQADFDSEGWAIAGWQLFNWNGVAALGVIPKGFRLGLGFVAIIRVITARGIMVTTGQANGRG